MENERNNLYGRFERDRSFATFEPSGDAVMYIYGTVGFENHVSRLIDHETAQRYSVSLQAEGYRKVTEVPISEGNNADAGILLDWMGGITR